MLHYQKLTAKTLYIISRVAEEKVNSKEGSMKMVAIKILNQLTEPHWKKASIKRFKALISYSDDSESAKKDENHRLKPLGKKEAEV